MRFLTDCILLIIWRSLFTMIVIWCGVLCPRLSRCPSCWLVDWLFDWLVVQDSQLFFIPVMPISPDRCSAQLFPTTQSWIDMLLLWSYCYRPSIPQLSLSTSELDVSLRISQQEITWWYTDTNNCNSCTQILGNCYYILPKMTYRYRSLGKVMLLLLFYFQK